MALPLAWLAGIAPQLRDRELMPLALYVALAALAARRDRVDRDAIRMRRYSVAILAGASAGFASADWQASLRLAETLPAAIEGRDIVVTGILAGMPQQRPSGLRFRFVVDPDGAPPGVPALLALGWYAGFDEDAAPVQPRQACAPASAGASRCGCASRTATSTRTASTTSSRYSYVRRAAPPPVLLASDAGHPVERLRQRVRDAIYKQVSDGRRRRPGCARGRRPGRDRARRLGSLPQRRCRPP